MSLLKHAFGLLPLILLVDLFDGEFKDAVYVTISVSCGLNFKVTGGLCIDFSGEYWLIWLVGLTPLGFRCSGEAPPNPYSLSLSSIWLN